MQLFSKGTSAARTALIYITLGALVLVWTGVYFIWVLNHRRESDSDTPMYWCVGLLATGLTLLLIGFGLGRIGRAAQHAEPMTTTTVSPNEQAVAQLTNQVPAVPVAPPAPGVTPVVPATSAAVGQPVAISDQPPSQR